MNGGKKIRKKQNVAPEAKKEAGTLTRENTSHPQSLSNKEKSLKALDRAPGNKTTSYHTGERNKSSKAFEENYSPAAYSAHTTVRTPFPVEVTRVEQPRESRIVLMDVDPYWVHLYWEITPGDRQNLVDQLDKSLHPLRQVIRVYDVTFISFDGSNAHSYFDIEVASDKGNWYIDLWSPHKSVCSDIGMKSPRGNFYSIARSNFIDTPRDSLSSSGEEQWMKVSGAYEEIFLFPLPIRTERQEGDYTYPPRENAYQNPDLKTIGISLSGDKIRSESPLAKKENTVEKTTFRKDSQSLPSTTHKDTTRSKSVKERETRDYYRKLRLKYSREGKRIQSPHRINPHHPHDSTLQEVFTPRLFPDLATHCGSNTRWEKELTHKK